VNTIPVRRLATIAASVALGAVTTSPITVSAGTADDAWRAQAAAVCAAYSAELASQPPATASVDEHVAFWRDLHDRLPSLATIEFPHQLRTAPTDVPAVMRRQDELLVEAERAVTAGDVATADRALNHSINLLEHAAALVTLGGAECGDPTRAANASLNIPIPNAYQVATGFGSAWASTEFGNSIVRVDAQSGDVQSTVDVGSQPFKAQPADGRMVVRTADAYVAIDPATNTVVATLPKPDVGPAANRSWAVDGAMWICDGERLHRYDPATFQPADVTIELGIDCGQVVATTDLVVAWTYNEDPGESGTAAAAFVDPASNRLLATTNLPADATVPVILDDAVYFPAKEGTVNAVVDRATWEVAATPDYGREIDGSQMAFDGEAIYVLADGVDVLAIDPHTYEVTDVIEPLTIVTDLNALAVSPGALWVIGSGTSILQRFDIS
jgi:hypothetical protein